MAAPTWKLARGPGQKPPLVELNGRIADEFVTLGEAQGVQDNQALVGIGLGNFPVGSDILGFVAENRLQYVRRQRIRPRVGALHDAEIVDDDDGFEIRIPPEGIQQKPQGRRISRHDEEGSRAHEESGDRFGSGVEILTCAVIVVGPDDRENARENQRHEGNRACRNSPADGSAGQRMGIALDHRRLRGSAGMISPES